MDELGTTSHELDAEIVFETQGAEGEMEAMAVKGVLDAGGLHPILVGSSTLPSLPFVIQVPREEREEALRLIAEAAAAGPAAAEEAARATE